MDNDNDGLSGMTDMRMACVQLHEMYSELRHAGFSRHEALFLVSKVLTDGAKE